MTGTDILHLALAVIGSLGGGALIVLALANWLGQVWASRLMLHEKIGHEKALETLRSELALTNSKNLEQLRREFDVAVTTHLREVNEKIAIYRMATDIISEALGDFDLAFLSNSNRMIAPDRRDLFNRQRIKAYGYMGMLAPQSVMDAFDRLIDHLMLVSASAKPYDWKEVRLLALDLINEIRKDVGIDKTSIQYRGQL